MSQETRDLQPEAVVHIARLRRRAEYLRGRLNESQERNPEAAASKLIALEWAVATITSREARDGRR